MVTPKKHLGQHFLTDENICRNIAGSILFHQDYQNLLEIGPGTGALTKHLMKLSSNLEVMEVDTESIDFLNEAYPDLKVHNANFLKADLESIFAEQVGIVGNFPYNISSQILFVILRYRHLIPEMVGMFQKEVAERVCEKPGSKTYGILSVLCQAFYDVEYLFTVSENVFNPPPKVKSGVMRMRRKSNINIGCDEALFFKIVKQAFNQRRKTIRNSLKSLLGETKLPEDLSWSRPEQLDWLQFVELTKLIQAK